MLLKINTFCILLTFIGANKKELCNDLNSSDDDYSKIILSNHLPFGLLNKTNIIINSVMLDEWDECVKYCCEYKQCDAVLFNYTHCEIIRCENLSLCQPIEKKSDQLYAVFTNTDVNSGKIGKNDIDDGISSCEINIANSCRENQFCQQIQENRRSGVCKCITGFFRKGNDCTLKEYKKEFNQTKMKITEKVPSEIYVTYINNITQAYSSTIKSATKNVTKENILKSQLMTANAGPDLNVNVLKSSLLDKPAVVLIQGMATFDNQTTFDETLLYNWKRLPDSIAAGTIINNSQNKSTLILTNLIQGQYLFELTITSPDGNIAKDKVKLNVVEIGDEIDLNLIAIVFQTNIYQFSEKEKENFSKRITHVIEKHFLYQRVLVEIHSVSPDKENNTRIIFYAEKFNETMNRFQLISSNLLERGLKNKVLNHKFIFDYSVKSFRSLFCHDNCGGHGSCDQNTHRCKCLLPWFNNVFTEYKSGFSNCDMHVMIVAAGCSVGIFFLVIFIILCKKLLRKFRLRSKYGKKVLQYRLLDDTDS